MSEIDTSVPPYGDPTTAAVRANFQTAANEIDAATAAAAAAQATADSKLSDAPSDGSLYARMNAAWTLVPAPPAAASTPPLMDGAGAVGTGNTWARSDHQHPSDTSKLSLTGGTMTGAIVLAADPAANMQPVTLQYYNAHLPAVPAASTTLPAMNGVAAIGTGNTWARSDHVHASDTTKLSLSGGTLTGPLIAAADPTVSLGVATKQYVDSKGGLADAPSDGTAYGRLNAAWVHVVTTFNSRTGAVALTSGDVTGALGYTPLPTSGGNISGNLVVSGQLNAGAIQATSYFAAYVGGWAYTSTGPGASTGTFNFGVSAGSYACAGSMFFAASDRRLKEDITTITADDGIEWVQKARPVTFLKIGSPGAGFISQEQIAAGYGQYVATMPYEGLAEETDQAGVRSMADVALYLDSGNYVAYLTAALQSVLQRLAVVEAALAAKS